MKDEFLKKYNQLHLETIQLLHHLHQYNNEVLNKTPPNGGWSVIEVLLHLLAAEEASLNYLRKKASLSATISSTGLTEKIKYALLQLAFILPFKYKAPVVTQPKKNIFVLDEIEEKWKDIHTNTIIIVSNLNTSDFSKKLWLHPVIGKTNLMAMVNFTAIHFNRHKTQVHSILNELNLS